MNRNLKWVVAAAAAVLFAGSLGFGSNMGFKYNASVVDPDPVLLAPTGDNWLVIPFNNPYGTAIGLCQALGFTGSETVARVNPFTGAFENAVCSVPLGNNFPIVDCISVKLTVPVGAPTSKVLVGSHDPSKTCNLIDNPLPGQFAPFGDNYVSIPYHTTATDLEDACLDVGPNASTVAYREPISGSFVTRVCGAPTTPDPLPLGRGIKVTLSGDANDTSWVPSHF